MRIFANKSSLLDGISTVQKAVPSKTTLPILEGILLEAGGGKLKITGTDLEIGIETTINVDVVEPGRVVVSSKLFGEIIRKMPNADVEIFLKDSNVLNIKCEGSSFKLIGINSDDFPELPKIVKENAVSLTQKNLKEMIRHTIFSVATEDLRPIITGILFEFTEEKATMVALDGFRMAVKWDDIKSSVNNKVVIPGKTMSEISKILEDSEDLVNIYFSKNQALFQINETMITTRLLEGEFINYKQIIPAEYKINVITDTHKLIEACERAALFARDSNSNMIKFEISDEKMVIRSNSQNGDVQEELMVEKEGIDIEIAFNAKYFMDALKVIDTEKIKIEFINNVSPCILKPFEKDGYLYLVLPSRFKK